MHNCPAIAFWCGGKKNVLTLVLCEEEEEEEEEEKWKRGKEEEGRIYREGAEQII